jgi:hypothetical protein
MFDRRLPAPKFEGAASWRRARWVAASVAAIVVLAAGVALATSVSLVSKSGTLQNDSNVHVLKATCPTGTKAAGGGVKLGDNYNDFVQGSFPSSTNHRVWVGEAWRSSSETATATFTAYAMCVKGQLKYVSHSKSLAADSTTHTTSVACPTGTRVTGGGIQLKDDVNDYVEGSYPSGSAGWVVQAYRDSGQSTASSFKAWAVCVPSGQVTVKSKKFSLPQDSAGHIGKVTCPTGTHVTGGGVKLTSPNADTPEGSYPASKTAWDGVAARYGTGTGSFTSFAICVK